MTGDPPESKPYAQLGEYVELWAANGPWLAEIHDQQVGTADTAAAIRMFESAFRIALHDLPLRPSSGLIDWHRRLRHGRERG